MLPSHVQRTFTSIYEHVCGSVCTHAILTLHSPRRAAQHKYGRYRTHPATAAPNVYVGVCRRIWPICVPLLFVILLLAAREAIVTRQPTGLSQAVSVLWREYNPNLFFWGVVELIRRLSLTSFMPLIGEEATLIRLFLALLVSVI